MNNNNNNTRDTSNGKSYQDIKSVVLLNSFQIDKKRYRVYYNNGILIWEREKSNKNKVCIPIEDIVSVCYPKKKNSGAPTSPQQVFPIANGSQNTSINPSEIAVEIAEDFRSFNINYAKRVIDPKVQEGGGGKSSGKTGKEANTWRIYSITMHNNDKNIIKEWHDTLTEILNGLKRPRKLLLFVNPYGGKKNALQLYEKYAKPIFLMAGVDVSVVVSQRQNQIFDLVMQQQFDQFDGIACAGGDGTFSELFNGIIFRKMMAKAENNESNLDYENIPYPEIPCGIIPAGSTDTIAYCLHGTTDIKTCIIHIVLGQTTGFDLSSISNDKGILKFYASVVAYGYLGDIAYENDAYRFLGPRRYEYVGFKKVVGNQGYEAEVHILEEPPNRTDCDIKCYENCSVCSKPDDGPSTLTEGQEHFKRITGKFLMINCANISCACDRSPSGFSPTCHLGDGYIHLILVRHGSILNNVKLLLRMASGKKEISELPFVEVHRTKKIYVKAINGTSMGSITDSTQPLPLGPNKYSSVWNCDGEVVQDTDVMVRSHRQLLTVYRRGAKAEEEKSSSGCCNCFS